MTASRRLAAILAADVVGYRGSGQDEADGGRSAAARGGDPIVARMGGRIVKTTGDGLLLEFPSVVAAVEARKLMAERADVRK